jgi:hypothetical protein
MAGKMSWKGYERMRATLGVQLVGLPDGTPMKSDPQAYGMGQLKKFHKALTDGSCRWEKLADAEWEEVRKVYNMEQVSELEDEARVAGKKAKRMSEQGSAAEPSKRRKTSPLPGLKVRYVHSLSFRLET